MRFVDVNVLVYAHRPETPSHDGFVAWLDACRAGEEPLGLSSLVSSGFLRVVTHPRLFREPTPLDVAFEFVEALRRSPSVIEVAPGARHWEIFARLCREGDVRGNLVPDAYLAAMAIESGATMYSADRGFARFPGLRWQHPLDA